MGHWLFNQIGLHGGMKRFHRCQSLGSTTLACAGNFRWPTDPVQQATIGRHCRQAVKARERFQLTSKDYLHVYLAASRWSMFRMCLGSHIPPSPPNPAQAGVESRNSTPIGAIGIIDAVPPHCYLCPIFLAYRACTGSQPQSRLSHARPSGPTCSCRPR